MNIISLGHSCFVLEIEGNRSDPVRILADPWITDHVIGDASGRFPRIRIDHERMPQIDAIYLSHSHTDHLDPYSLIQLHNKLLEPPKLLLPISLAYLEPLFIEFLPDWERIWLPEGEPIDLFGLEISAFFNLETRATNEDDVMILMVRNGQEVFVSESDALLPFADLEARESIAGLFAEVEETDQLPTRVFLTTRNELEATMASLRARGEEERREAAAESAGQTLEEIEAIFAPAGGELVAPWDMPGIVRLVIGQGIAFPGEIDADWNRVLFPISLEDRVRFEHQVAQGHGYDLPIEALTGGEAVSVVDGIVRDISVDWFYAIDQESDRAFDPSIDRSEDDFPIAPLFDGVRDTSSQRIRILEVLNGRFLPWWIGSRNPPVEHILAQSGGEYRIRVRYGVSEDYRVEDYIATHRSLRFCATETHEDPEQIDEEYWANDLEDYLDGRADDFSTFCRRPPGGHSTRLWDCLGMPYLNDDLVERKLRLHFERASRGESGEAWVLALWNEG